MNIVISEGGSVLIDFEIAKESHVYVNNGVIDFYREWEELPAQDGKNSWRSPNWYIRRSMLN